MTAAHRAAPRVPAPIIVVVILIALNFLALGFVTVQVAITGSLWAIVPFVFAVIEGLVVVGLWAGNRAAYIVAILFGVLLVLGAFGYAGEITSAGGVAQFGARLTTGALLLVLLLLPASARRHFQRV